MLIDPIGQHDELHRIGIQNRARHAHRIAGAVGVVAERRRLRPPPADVLLRMRLGVGAALRPAVRRDVLVERGLPCRRELGELEAVAAIAAVAAAAAAAEAIAHSASRCPRGLSDRTAGSSRRASDTLDRHVPDPEEGRPQAAWRSAEPPSTPAEASSRAAITARVEIASVSFREHSEASRP